MRSCPNCGAQFSDSEVFCPVCGQEVQMVPDFVTTEIQLQELQKKIKEEERLQEEARLRAETIQRRIRQRRNHVILIFCLIGAAIASWFVITYVKEVQREHSSFSYKFTQAKTLYEQGDLLSARDFVDLALQMNPDDRNALLLEAHILLDSKQDTEAENLLFHYLEKYPDEDGYMLLIDMYLDADRTEDVQTILMDCTVPSVLETYARFLPAGPMLYPQEGVYNTDQEIYLASEVKGTIYYTTDGSDPTSSSEEYDKPIALTEGIYTIKAMLITDEGFPSPVTAGIYQVQYDAPPPPQISPDSGTYSVTRNADGNGRVQASEKNKVEQIILSYPDGFICHYSFDQKPTKDSPVYTKPLEMRQGEHIFYAVLESENGKLGMIASATYIYDVRTVTPAPKKKTYYYGAQSGQSQQTPTPEPTAAPEPTSAPAPAPNTVPDQPTPDTPSSDGGGTVPDTPPEPTAAPDQPTPDTPPSDGGGTVPDTPPSDGGQTDGGSSADPGGGGGDPSGQVPDAGGGAAEGGAAEVPVNNAPVPDAPAAE